MTDDFNKGWIDGNRSAWSDVLEKCLYHLHGEEFDLARLVLEREKTMEELRIPCYHYGDNDWDPRNVRLNEIIERHLDKLQYGKDIPIELSRDMYSERGIWSLELGPYSNKKGWIR